MDQLIGGTKSFVTMEILFSSAARFGASVSTILARASTSSLVSICQLYTAELFPTPIRQSTLGACLGLAAALGTAGPYLGGSLVSMIILIIV